MKARVLLPQLTLVALAAALASAPWWAENNTIRVLGEFCVTVALATLWNLLAGYAGLVSVGQQAFVGVGAYTVAILQTYFGLPFWITPWNRLNTVSIGVPVLLIYTCVTAVRPRAVTAAMVPSVATGYH